MPVLIAVLSDIHANLEALQAALRLAESRGADAVACLGDIVGYGPSPGECLDLIRAEAAVCVIGNHDEAVATGRGVEVLPRDGQEAAELHRRSLSADQLEWLAALPLRQERWNATFVHASPLDPEQWTRLESYSIVREQFAAFTTPICFVGHSHKPAVVCETMGVFKVRPGHRFLVDVGSVGQPRDHDARLSFALFDTEAFTVEPVREHYDHARTVLEIGHVGLPEGLGDRLRRGV